MKNAIHRVTKHNYIIHTCLLSCLNILDGQENYSLCTAQRCFKRLSPGPNE